MRRRTFIKAALWPIYLPLIRGGSVKRTSLSSVTYTDSDNHDAATLAALADKIPTAGGVEYQP